MTRLVLPRPHLSEWMLIPVLVALLPLLAIVTTVRVLYRHTLGRVVVFR